MVLAYALIAEKTPTKSTRTINQTPGDRLYERGFFCGREDGAYSSNECREKYKPCVGMMNTLFDNGYSIQPPLYKVYRVKLI